MRNPGLEEAQAGIKIAGRNQGWQGPILPFPETALILEGEDETEVVRDYWEAQMLEVIFFFLFPMLPFIHEAFSELLLSLQLFDLL